MRTLARDEPGEHTGPTSPRNVSEDAHVFPRLRCGVSGSFPPRQWRPSRRGLRRSPAQLAEQLIQGLELAAVVGASDVGGQIHQHIVQFQ